MALWRADLREVDGLRDCRRWRSGAGVVTVGRMPAPQVWHFAWHSAKGSAYVTATEREACGLAERWLRCGNWAEELVLDVRRLGH